MPEPRDDANGNWSADALYIYFSRIFAERTNRYEDRFSSLDRVIRDGNESIEKRINEHVSSAVDMLQLAISTVKESAGAALSASKESVDKAEAANDRRFASVNEFRGTLSDQATRFITRTEVDAKLDGMSEKLSNIIARVDRMESKGAGLASGWGYLVAGVGLIATLITIFYALSRVAH